jgi:hypothetical protein
VTERGWETFAAVSSQRSGFSLSLEALVRVASSPDNDGTRRYCRTARVRQARREGGREEPAV